MSEALPAPRSRWTLTSAPEEAKQVLIVQLLQAVVIAGFATKAFELALWWIPIIAIGYRLLTWGLVRVLSGRSMSADYYVADGAALELDEDSVRVFEGGDAEPVTIPLDELEIETGRTWFAVRKPSAGYRRSISASLFEGGVEEKDAASRAILEALEAGGPVETRLNRHFLIGSRTHRRASAG